MTAAQEAFGMAHVLKQHMPCGRDPPLATFWAHEQPRADVLTVVSSALSNAAANTRQVAHDVVYGRKDGYRAGAHDSSLSIGILLI